MHTLAYIQYWQDI